MVAGPSPSNQGRQESRKLLICRHPNHRHHHIRPRRQDTLTLRRGRMGQYTRDSRARVLAASTTTMEAMKREPQRKATGAIAALTPTYHGKSYPRGGASRIVMAVTIPFFQPARSAKLHENRPNEPKTRLSFKNSIASSLSLLSARRFEVLSANPRDP